MHFHGEMKLCGRTDLVLGRITVIGSRVEGKPHLVSQARTVVRVVINE